MTVRAQQLKVLEPVVEPIAIHVMERHRQWPSEPLGDSADLTAVLLEPLAEQPPLEVAAVHRTPRDQVDRQRGPMRARSDRAPGGGVHECLACEPELLLALRDRVPRVVEALHLIPVVAAVAPSVDAVPEPP